MLTLDNCLAFSERLLRGQMAAAARSMFRTGHGVRRIALWFLLACACAAMGGRPDAAAAEPSKGDLVAGVQGNQPGAVVIDREGRPHSLGIEVVEEWARTTGLHVRFEVYPTTGQAIEALANGQIDLIPALAITEGRKARLDFSMPIVTARMVLAIRADSIGIRGLSDLEGRPVAVVSANFAEEQVRRQGMARIVRFAQPGEAIFALLSGNEDGMIYYEQGIDKLMRDIGLQGRIVVAGLPLQEATVAIAFAKGRADLVQSADAFLASFIRSDAFRDLYVKYNGGPRPFWTVGRVAGTAGSLLLIVAVALVAWRYVSLISIHRRLLAQQELNRRAQVQLEASQRLLQTVFDTIPNLLILKDTHGRFTMVNAAYSRFYGVPAAQVVGRLHAEITGGLEPAQSALIAESDRDAVEKGEPVHVPEIRARSALGEERWFTTDRLPLRDPSSRIVGLIGIATDDTERTLAEDALRRSETLLREAERLNGSGNFDWDIRTRKLTWSDGMYTLLGWAPQAFPCTYEAYVAQIHPEDREAAEQAIQRAVDSGADFRMDYRIVRADGAIRYVSGIRKVIRDAAGQSVRMIGVATDITERKATEVALRESRQLLQDLFDAVPQHVYVKDLDGRYLLVNNAMARFKGLSPAEILGTTVLDHFGRQHDHAVRLAAADRAVVESAERQELTVLVPDAEGRGRWLRNIKLPRRDSEGRLIGTIGVTEDITEQRASEEALRKSEERARTILEIVHDGILTITDRGIVESLNPAAETVFGYSRGEVIGQNVKMLMPEPYSGEHDRYLSSYLETGKKKIIGIGREVLGRRKDGSIFPMDLAVSEFRLGDTRMFAGVVRDITARRQAEERIARLNQDLERRVVERTAALDAERRFTATVLDTQEALVLVVAADGEIVWYNKACAALTQYPIEEVLGRNILDLFILPEERETSAGNLKRLRPDGFPYRHIRRWRNRSGESRLISWHSSAILDEQGAIKHVIGTGIDITGRQQIEDALRASEHRYRTLVETMNEGLAFLDPAGAIVLTNPAFCQMLGYAKEELEGQNMTLLVADGQRAAVVERRARRASGTRETYELDLVRKDGAVIRVLNSVTLLDDGQGRPLGTLGMLTDITARKEAEDALRESEARYRSLVETMNEGMTVLDPTGNIILANPAACRMLGYTQQELLGRNVVSLVPDQERAAVIEKRALRKPGARDSYEWGVLRKDGAVIRVMNSVVSLAGAQGEAGGTIAMLTDITERVEAERKLAKLREQMAIQQKMATIGQLTATVSHELRNPLGTIRTSVSTLQQRAGAAESPESKILERIERNVVRCTNIITDLLDFSRSREARPEWVAIDPWLRDLMAEQARPEWLGVELDLATGGLVLSVDPDRLRRAVINVLENAVQAMTQHREEHPGHPCRLTVRSRVEAGQLDVTVEDSGPGMAPEVLQRIFELLFSTKNFGVGLGLPTVKQIMENEGGRVDIVSQPGQGTRASLRLPLENRIRESA